MTDKLSISFYIARISHSCSFSVDYYSLPSLLSPSLCPLAAKTEGLVVHPHVCRLSIISEVVPSSC